MQYKLGKTLTRAVRGALGVAAIGTGGIIAGAAIYATLTINGRKPTTFYDSYTFTPYEAAIPGFEEITFATEDKLALHGWWLPYPGAQQTVINLGGYHSPGTDMLGVGSGLWRAGFNILLFDWRSRGLSPSAQHSPGYYELRDAQAALAYALQRAPATTIGVIGYSMGASLALILAAANPVIQAVIADSPFTSIGDVVGSTMERYGLPAGPVVALADVITGWRYGYHFDAIRPIDAAPALAARPLLLIHGTEDSVIPVEHTHRIAAVNPGTTEVWTVAGVEHCGAYFANRSIYVERITRFFKQHLAVLIPASTDEFVSAPPSAA